MNNKRMGEPVSLVDVMPQVSGGSDAGWLHTELTLTPRLQATARQPGLALAAWLMTPEHVSDAGRVGVARAESQPDIAAVPASRPHCRHRFHQHPL